MRGRLANILENETRFGIGAEFKHLAWLTLDEEDALEYWNAMNLMGRYAAASDELIHRHIARMMGARVILDIENPHNFSRFEIREERTACARRISLPKIKQPIPDPHLP